VNVQSLWKDFDAQWHATGHRNPSKVTERSLNILLLDNLVV